jgi:hypothetical protein
MTISASLSSYYLNVRQAATAGESPASRQAEQPGKNELAGLSWEFSVASLELQLEIDTVEFKGMDEAFKAFLDTIGYEGKSLDELSQEEAKELVSDGGFFGIEQTAKRISDFVLMGAGDNEELLRAGRQGVLQGFEEAEKIWGEKLPDISYKTIEKAIETIDTAMHDYGYSILNAEV